MRYVIGIDGGGTKTKLCIYDLDTKAKTCVISGPSNILSSGYETTKNSLEEAIQKGVIEKGYKLKDCLAFCLGVAGAARECVKQQLNQIIREEGYNGKLIITHDAETAFKGALGGEEGILIIAGTGVICYGESKIKGAHRISGWGHIIGDEGSGYSIGKKILNAVMKNYDGRGNQTILKELVLHYLCLKNEEEIISYIYQPHITKVHIAELAILLEVACSKKDKVALEIANEAIEDLYECVKAALEKLDLSNKEIKIAINGSVLIKNRFINEGFKKKVLETYPLINIIQDNYDPVEGAITIALSNI